jgi:hypothetical protein
MFLAKQLTAKTVEGVPISAKMDVETFRTAAKINGTG